jgi:hypothetical protein
MRWFILSQSEPHAHTWLQATKKLNLTSHNETIYAILFHLIYCVFRLSHFCYLYLFCIPCLYIPIVLVVIMNSMSLSSLLYCLTIKCRPSIVLICFLMACSNNPLGASRGRYDKHSSKSSSSCETKIYQTSRRKPNFRRWCLLASRHSRQWRQKTCWCVVDVGASSPSSNVKPAHNTTKNFASNLRWGCQSHRFAVNKGLSVSSGKRIIIYKKVNRASNSKTVKLCKGNWTGVHSSLLASLHKINNNMLGKQIIVGQLIE